MGCILGREAHGALHRSFSSDVLPRLVGAGHCRALYVLLLLLTSIPTLPAACYPNDVSLLAWGENRTSIAL